MSKRLWIVYVIQTGDLFGRYDNEAQAKRVVARYNKVKGFTWLTYGESK